MIICVADAPFCSPHQLYKYAARVGDTIPLQCRVEANPAATVFFGWSEDGEPYDVSSGTVDDSVDDMAYTLKNYTVE